MIAPRDTGRFARRGSEPDVRPVLCPVLIGRDHEVAALDESLDQADKGHGGTMLLLGEAGVGKSRLAREGVRLADERGWVVLGGRAVPSATPVAFRALAEALLSVSRSAGLPEGPELDPFRPALGRLVPQWRHAGTPDAGESIVVLAEGVLQLLRSLAAGRGCLLVLEDLHWADPETLAIVEYLADNLPLEPVLCLATVRTEETSDAMALARALRARRTGCVLELGRLGPADVEGMATACLGGSSLPEEATQALTTWAEGVPFFIEELLAAWVSGGTLAPGATGWSVAKEIEAAVPLTFADSIGRRLAALGPTAETVLQAAAVVGRRFDWTLLPLMTGHGEDTVLDVLREATDAQLIAPDIEGAGFKFRHALTRDAIADTLLPPQRQALSRSALRAVETAYPGLPGDWCELAAGLALAAGDTQAAGDLLLEAGRRAMVQGALGTAAAILRRGRELPELVVGTVNQIDDALCDALALAGQAKEAAAVGKGLLDRLRGQDAPPASQARVHLRLARAAVSTAQWEEAEQHLDATAALDLRGTESELDAQRASLSAQVAIGRDHVEEARALAEGALAEAEAAGLPVQTCEALEVLGRCLIRHDLAAAEAAFERARAVAAAHGLTVWHIRATTELGGLDLLAGRPIDRLDEAARLAREAGALVTAASVDLHRGFWLLDHHRLDEAMIASHRCAEAATRFHFGVLAGVAHFQQALIHAFRGEQGNTDAALERSARLAHPGAMRPEYPSYVRALEAFRDDDLEQARRQLDGAIDHVRRTGSTPAPFLGWWAVLRTLAADDGEAARAEIRASAAGPRVLTRGFLDFSEAVDAGRAGDADQAMALAAAADDAMAQYPFFHHHCQRLIAEAALEDGWGEPVAWLREALDFFEAEEQKPLARACRSLLTRAGDPGMRRRRPPEGLPSELATLGITRRELDVLELLADGRATREIAERLYLSPKTVERHIANLVDKAGVAGRAQLVAFAAKQALRRPD